MELRFSDFDQREQELERRLARVQHLCRSLAVSVLVYGGLIWFLVYGEPLQPLPWVPAGLPLSLTALAMILMLVASRLRGAIVRRAFPSHSSLPVHEEAVIAAYQRATLISFVLLDAAAVLGLGVALLSGSALYGGVLCAAALIGMLVRWPRATELDRLLRGRASL
jgi:hypothetical protein